PCRCRRRASGHTKRHRRGDAVSHRGSCLSCRSGPGKGGLVAPKLTDPGVASAPLTVELVGRGHGSWPEPGEDQIVLLVVILMVFLGLVERACLKDRRYDFLAQ